MGAHKYIRNNGRPFRLAPRLKPQFNIIRRKKEYNGHENTRKRWINKLFADNVIQHLGVETKTIVLDTEKAITIKALETAGISHKNVTAPNINLDICHTLTQMGVFAPHATIEECVRTCGIVHGAAFLDSMTTIAGNAAKKHFIGVFVQHFLKQNRGKNCVLAITIATRSNQVNANINDQDGNKMSQKKILKFQIQALIAKFGFAIDSEQVHKYKKGLCFSMWNLTWAPEQVQVKPLLTWKESDRLIGFPPGFTSNTLADYISKS